MKIKDVIRPNMFALKDRLISLTPLLLSELYFFKEAGELCESLQNLHCASVQRNFFFFRPHCAEFSYGERHVRPAVLSRSDWFAKRAALQPLSPLSYRCGRFTAWGIAISTVRMTWGQQCLSLYNSPWHGACSVPDAASCREDTFVLD